MRPIERCHFRWP